MSQAIAAEYGARIQSYMIDAPPGHEFDSIEIIQTGAQRDGQFDPAADVWAIRKLGHHVLNHDGQWEIEPQPSSRDDEFMARCRFTLMAALPAADAAMRKLRSRIESPR